jgi:hypothetical protein
MVCQTKDGMKWFLATIEQFGESAENADIMILEIMEKSNRARNECLKVFRRKDTKKRQKCRRV